MPEVLSNCVHLWFIFLLLLIIIVIIIIIVRALEIGLVGCISVQQPATLPPACWQKQEEARNSY
jgi:hypothetical protein